MATLLSITTAAVDELGNIARPSAVFTSSDRTVQRMVALSNREGKDIVASAQWTILQRLYTFATVNGTQEYALPSDYSRLLITTEWNRSAATPLIGPLSPEQWQAIESGGVSAVPFGGNYRIMRSAVSGNSRMFRITPTPTSAQTLGFEYISTNWCASSGGTAQSAWAADTDVTIVDPDLMTLGLIVRFKRAIGLDYASEADEYSNMLATKSAQDRPAPVLSMVPGATASRRGLTGGTAGVIWD